MLNYNFINPIGTIDFHIGCFYPRLYLRLPFHRKQREEKNLTTLIYYRRLIFLTPSQLASSTSIMLYLWVQRFTIFLTRTSKITIKTSKIKKDLALFFLCHNFFRLFNVLFHLYFKSFA